MTKELDTEFMKRYWRPQSPRLPKYAEFREMLLAAIEDEYWSSGERVPNEASLVAATPYSLGTVQKAMRDLVQSGIIVRQRGRGTFVTEKRQAMDAPLHFRFEDESGKSLPVYPSILERRFVSAETTPFFFPREENDQILQIKRKLSISRIFEIYSVFYINGKKFPIFSKKKEDEIVSCNFKNVMLREYNVKVRSIEQLLYIEEIPSDICDFIEVPENTVGSKIKLGGRGTNGEPLYYQEMFVPPNPCRLHLPDWNLL